ncbi:hypothetical protein M758_2G192900 [Ceratodon purpureus]|nr:hypothetical protein M758_2G192900 [Ceratodon purpureus]
MTGIPSWSSALGRPQLSSVELQEFNMLLLPALRYVGILGGGDATRVTVTIQKSCAT